MTHEITHDHHETENSLISLLSLIGGLLALLLGLRFVLLLFGISNVRIANFTYGVTEVFVKPFYGLFGRTYLSGTPQIEIEAIIAMFVIWFLIALVGSILRGFR